jgi:hypothetical protein
VKGFEPSAAGATTQCSNQLSYTHHIIFIKGRCPFRANGAPGGTRTPGPQLRRLLLYPVELQAPGFFLPLLPGDVKI